MSFWGRARRWRLALIVLVVAAVAGGTALALGSGGGSTPPDLRDSGDQTVVWAVGDGADGSDEAKEVAETIEAAGLDRLLYLGDVYQTGTAEEFERNYEPVYGRFAEITEPTPGNHEWYTREEGYLPYWREVEGQPQPLHYSFRLGGWEIISLNSEPESRPEPRQLAWLRKQLAEPGTCRLAFWHTSRYSAVPDGDEPRIQPFWDALAGHAALVVSAHEHNMQRFEPIEGITQLVSGAGGHGLYQLDSDDPRLAFGDDEHYGALRLALEPHRARFAFVGSGGTVLDAGEVACDPLGQAP